MPSPQRVKGAFRAVVLTMEPGWRSALYRSISQYIVVIMLHVLPGGQHTRVVLPAVGIQVDPFWQQKLSGHFRAEICEHWSKSGTPHCDESRSSKIWFGGMVEAEAIMPVAKTNTARSGIPVLLILPGLPTGFPGSGSSSRCSFFVGELMCLRQGV